MHADLLAGAGSEQHEGGAAASHYQGQSGEGGGSGEGVEEGLQFTQGWATAMAAA